jgi:hypothetical protein
MTQTAAPMMSAASSAALEPLVAEARTQASVREAELERAGRAGNAVRPALDPDTFDRRLRGVLGLAEETTSARLRGAARHGQKLGFGDLGPALPALPVSRPHRFGNAFRDVASRRQYGGAAERDEEHDEEGAQDDEPRHASSFAAKQPNLAGGHR